VCLSCSATLRGLLSGASVSLSLTRRALVAFVRITFSAAGKAEMHDLNSRALRTCHSFGMETFEALVTWEIKQTVLICDRYFGASEAGVRGALCVLILFDTR